MASTQSCPTGEDAGAAAAEAEQRCERPASHIEKQLAGTRKFNPAAAVPARSALRESGVQPAQDSADRALGLNDLSIFIRNGC